MIFPSVVNEDFFQSILKFIALYGLAVLVLCMPTFVYMLVEFP